MNKSEREAVLKAHLREFIDKDGIALTVRCIREVVERMASNFNTEPDNEYLATWTALSKLFKYADYLVHQAWPIGYENDLPRVIQEHGMCRCYVNNKQPTSAYKDCPLHGD